MRFVVSRRGRGWLARNQYGFVLIADNGEIVAVSESYNNKGDVLDTIDLIRGRAMYATVEER